MLCTTGWSRRGNSEIKIFQIVDGEFRTSCRASDSNDYDSDDSEKVFLIENGTSKEEEEKYLLGEKTALKKKKNKNKDWNENRSDMTAIKFSENNKCVCVGRSNGLVDVLSTDGLRKIGEVRDVSARSDGQRFKDAVERARADEEEDDDEEVLSIDFHGSSRYLASGGRSSSRLEQVKVWDLKRRRVSRRLGGRDRFASVNAVKFNKGCRVLASADDLGLVLLHRGECFDDDDCSDDDRDDDSDVKIIKNDVRAEKELCSLVFTDDTYTTSASAVNCLDFSPHATMMLACGTSEGTVKIYDCESESLESTFIEQQLNNNNIIRSLEFSPSAPRILAIANEDGSVSIRDVALPSKTGVCITIPNPNKRWTTNLSHSFPGSCGAASAVSFHPSGNALAVGYRGNGVVSIYDCRSVRTEINERNNKSKSSINSRYTVDNGGDDDRVLHETEAHEGGRVIALRWQNKVSSKPSSSNSNDDSNGFIRKNGRKGGQEQRATTTSDDVDHHHGKAEEEEEKDKLLLFAETKLLKIDESVQAERQTVVDADEIAKKTKEYIKHAMEKEIKILRNDVKNLHLEILRSQEENALMFRKFHSTQLELLEMLKSSK